MAARIIVGSSYVIGARNPERLDLKPAKCHPQYDWLFSKWKRMRDAVEGEDAVKGRNEDYLPRRTGMDHAEYTAYLSRAVWFNATQKTVNDLFVSVFRRAPFVTLPKRMQGKMEDARNFIIAEDGTTILDLSKALVRELLTVSRRALLLDMDPTGQTKHIAEYSAESIVNWKVVRKKLVAVRLLEPKPSADFYTDVTQVTERRVRILALDSNGDYFQAVGTKEDDYSGDPNLIPQNERTYVLVRGQKLKYIPIVIFNAAGNGAAAHRPMLEDVANMNFAHYRSYAMLENARHVTATPIYFVKGRGMANEFADGKEGQSATQNFTMTPQSIWLLEADDEVGIVEYEGKGLQSLEEGMEVKEAQMLSLGARLLSQRKNSAARSEKSEEDQANSEEATLMDVVENASQGLTQLFKWWAEWELDNPEEVEIVLNRIFYRPKVTAREMRSLQSLFEAGLLPLRPLYESLKAGGFIPEDLEFATFEKAYKEWKAEQEAKEAAEAARKTKEAAARANPSSNAPPPRPAV